MKFRPLLFLLLATAPLFEGLAILQWLGAQHGVAQGVWPQDGTPRQVPVVDFVTGNHKNVLEKGELLRSIHLPASALSKRQAMRQMSLTHLGRSAALIIGSGILAARR